MLYTTTTSCLWWGFCTVGTIRIISRQWLLNYCCKHLSTTTKLHYSDSITSQHGEGREGDSKRHGLSIVQRVFVIQPHIRSHKINTQRTPGGGGGDMKLSEAGSLVNSLQGWSVTGSIIIHVKTNQLFTRHNLKVVTTEINILKKNNEISAVFVNEEILSTLQYTNLHKHWALPVFDRYTIVLMIFKEHAATREAKLQVQLAHIPYIRSRMSNRISDKTRIRDRGETGVELRRRIIDEKELKLKSLLVKLKAQRSLLRSARSRRQFPTVAVVGYTNAGKTSLIQALTGDRSMSGYDQLFSTLDVTTHCGRLPNNSTVLYIDTVGFISQLPHSLIDAFRATLEDVLQSDILVHVRDISHQDSEFQKLNVLAVLSELGVSSDRLNSIIEVWNKIDKPHLSTSTTDGGSTLKVVDDHGSVVKVSATRHLGLCELKELIVARILQSCDHMCKQYLVPMQGSQLSWLYDNTTVSHVTIPNDGDSHMILVDVVITTAKFAKFRSLYGYLESSGYNPIMS